MKSFIFAALSLLILLNCSACEMGGKKAEAAKENVENLFSVMLHRAFIGELTAKWREAHMKELLAEMEQQARLLRTTTETN